MKVQKVKIHYEVRNAKNEKVASGVRTAMVVVEENGELVDIRMNKPITVKVFEMTGTGSLTFSF
jgi:acyl-CoA thioesterase FadM